MQQRVRGEIAKLFTKKIDGKTHQCANIETDAGATKVVDLGAVQHLRSMDINKGDEVTVFGHSATRKGQSVFVANRVMASNRVMTVAASDHHGGHFSRRGRRSSPSSAGQHWISGEVKNVMTQPHGNTQHLIATIETNDGRHIEVDLGPKANLGNLQLDNGDNVDLYGEFMNGEFLASRVESDGQTLNLRGR